MDFSKKKARLSVEPLEARDVPALLGPVSLPHPAAPEAAVALTAPRDLGQDIESTIKIDFSDLNAGEAQDAEPTTSTDSANALKVRYQDFHFTQKVSKPSPMLFSSSEFGSPLKVGAVDSQYLRIKLQDILISG